MAKSVLNISKGVDATKQPMFFGPDLQIQRYDNMKYPIFDKLNQQQLGYFWRPEEVSLQKDRNDYLDLREEQKFIFLPFVQSSRGKLLRGFIQQWYKSASLMAILERSLILVVCLIRLSMTI